MDKNAYKSRLLKGFIVSNFIALLIIGLTKYFNPPYNSFIPSSEFIVLPVMMGIISAWFWRDLNLTGKSLTSKAVLNGLISILLSAVFLGEGMICLLIVSPLILAFIISGSFIGKAMFKRSNKNLNVSVVTLLLLIFINDSTAEHH